ISTARLAAHNRLRAGRAMAAERKAGNQHCDRGRNWDCKRGDITSASGGVHLQYSSRPHNQLLRSTAMGGTRTTEALDKRPTPATSATPSKGPASQSSQCGLNAILKACVCKKNRLASAPSAPI